MISKLRSRLQHLKSQVRNRRYKIERLLLSDDSSRLDDCVIDVRVPSTLQPRVTIGKRCIIRATFIFESNQGRVEIGDDVHLNGVTFISRTSISIANRCLFANGVLLYDHDSHSLQYKERNADMKSWWDAVESGQNPFEAKSWNEVESRGIVIEDECWIGLDSLILKGVKIGKRSVVGARSIVTRTVPSGSLVVGAPARVVKQIALL